ncbi:MAG: peptidoglycan-associated lipoprotein Pal [Acidobacteriota bacterium]
MSRTWMVGFAVFCVALLLAACAPKEEPTQPTELEVETKPVEQPKEVPPPPAPPVEEDVQETPWYENKSLRELNEEAERRGFHPSIYFDFDKADLTDTSRQKLTENARFLAENPTLKVTVEGHCDERGTTDYNLALGDRRANTAKDFTTDLNVDASRLRTISYGEERPVCTESTESCWARNRRAFFVLGF